MDSSGTFPQSISLLLVSDSHENLPNLSRLVSLCSSLPLDFIIHSGDFTNLRHSEQSDSLKVSNAESNVSAQIRLLETLGKPVLFVPGNHDPISLFPKLRPESRMDSYFSSRLLTVEPVSLAPGLMIAGVGGAPGVYRDGAELFEGFPYAQQEEYDDSFESLQLTDPEQQYILVTHTGPAHISTSIIHQLGKGRTISASERLYSLLLKPVLFPQTQNILLNVHGHMHPAVGAASLGKDKCLVVNPGSIL